MKYPIFSFIHKARVPLIAALAGGLLSAGIWHRAAADGSSAPLIATVNLTKIYDPQSWPEFDKQSKALDLERSNYKAIIDEVVPPDAGDAAIPPVDTETLRKWLELKEDTVLDAAHASNDAQNKLKDYENQAKQNTQQLADLIAKGDNLTAADKDNYTKLTTLRQGASDFITHRAQEYSDKIQKDLIATRAQLDGEVQNAVKQVADSKGISYVFSSPLVDQQGAQPVVMYSADKNSDITDLVLRKLK